MEGLKQLIKYQTLRLRSATDSLNFIRNVIRTGDRNHEKVKTTALAFGERLLLRLGASVSSDEWTSNDCCFKDTRAECGHVPDIL
jgi:hypothetical protein